MNAWIDGELDDATLVQITDHLDVCPECADQIGELLQTKAMLGSLDEAELPRSFAISPEMVKTASAPALHVVPGPEPIAAPTSIRRFEPVVRLLSIAAVLAFLVLGGANLAGIGQDHQPSADLAGNAPTATISDSTASQEQDSSQLRRGEVSDQGEAASNTDQSLQRVGQQDTAQTVDSESLSGMEIAIITTAVLALALIATWIWIHFRAGASR